MSRVAAILPATFLISASAIGYEILLVRVLSIVQWHHFAYMIISLALLGYGASGTFIALARRRLEEDVAAAFSICAAAAGLTMLLAFAIGQRVPFNALEIVWDPQQFLHLAAIYLVFFVPFFFAATCIGLALAFFRSEISRIYFVDLSGAAAGAVLVVGTLFVASPQTVLRLLSGMALLAALAAAAGSAQRSRLAASNVVLLILILALPSAWLELRMSPYKPLRQTLEVMGTQVLEERSNPLGLLTVVESSKVPLRHAPGLSLMSPHVPPAQLALFTDGDAMSTITRFDGDFDALGYLGDLTASLPYALLERPSVLVLGAGGGTDVLMALRHDARQVDAVELDPRVIALISSRYADFSGDLYHHQRVQVHAAEARGFMARSSARFDLIQLSAGGSASATAGATSGALSENYVYTVDAFETCLEHLAPGGLLAVTAWVSLPPRATLKLLAMAAEALRRSGVEEPGRRIAMIRNWNTATLLISASDFGPQATGTIRRFANERSFDTVWYPGMPADEANRFNRLPEPWLHEGARALVGPAAPEFIERYKFHIAPATDDRPYFSHFFRWRAFEEIMGLRARGGAGLVEWGYLVLVGTVVQAALAGAVLILLPLAAERHGRSDRGRKRTGAYFFLLGLAFMFIEIAFIQKFILFLGHPVYAVAVVLTGLLLFAGAGSAFAPRLERWTAPRRWRAIDVGVAGIVSLALLYLIFLPAVFGSLIGLPDAARIPIALLLLAPLAFLLGMPLPLGLARTARQMPDFVPWAWGLNGFASVLSAALASLLAIEFGFTAVILLAVVLYVLAAACARVWAYPITRAKKVYCA